MIDFIFAGAVYLALMFVVFFCLSFVTIGLTFSITMLVKRVHQWLTQPRYATQ